MDIVFSCIRIIASLFQLVKLCYRARKENVIVLDISFRFLAFANDENNIWLIDYGVFYDKSPLLISIQVIVILTQKIIAAIPELLNLKRENSRRGTKRRYVSYNERLSEITRYLF